MIFAYVKIFRIANAQATEIQRLESSINPADLLINNSNRDATARGIQRRTRKVHKDHKAIKTLGTLVGLFCISWLPFFIMYLTMAFCSSCVLPDMAASVITWLGYMNSCINPCVYAFLNRDFRLAFKRILSCGTSRRGYSNSTSNYTSGSYDMNLHVYNRNLP